MRLQLTIDMGDTKKPCMTPSEKAQKLVDKVTSGGKEDVSTEWEVLKEAYKRLQCLPQLTGEMQKVFEIIHPVIDTFIDMDIRDGDLMTSTDYMRWLSHDTDQTGGDENV